MAALETEVKNLRDGGSDETLAKIPALQEENRRLQENLDANKVVFPWVAVLSFLLGIGLGGRALCSLPVHRQQPDLWRYQWESGYLYTGPERRDIHAAIGNASRWPIQLEQRPADHQR